MELELSFKTDTAEHEVRFTLVVLQPYYTG